jgi:DNA-binding transcriptional ArsR family regulator
VAGTGLAAGALAKRLEARRPEIEQAVLTRVYAVEDPSEIRDPEYVLGLKEAVRSGVSYGLSALAGHEGSSQPIPPDLLSQARRAARSGVGLDTVLRRYVAAHTLLGDFIVGEAGAMGPSGRDLGHRALRVEAAVLDRLLDKVAVEHKGEREARLRTQDDRRLDLTMRLLAGEPVDTGPLDYGFAGWHTAVIVGGSGAEGTLRAFATSLGCRMLVIEHPEEVAWGWLGAGQPIRRERLEQALSIVPKQVELAFGEPARDLEGWRFSLRQARAAHAVSRRRDRTVTFYADVILLASALQDDVLGRSLEELYLAPLLRGRDRGDSLRSTLRAYFKAGCNVSSAAAALGISRQTVSKHLRIAELRVGSPLSSCAAEFDTALQLQSLRAVSNDDTVFTNNPSNVPLD